MREGERECRERRERERKRERKREKERERERKREKERERERKREKERERVGAWTLSQISSQNLVSVTQPWSAMATAFPGDIKVRGQGHDVSNDEARERVSRD